MSYFNGPWQARVPSATRGELFSAIFPSLTLFDLGAAGGTPPPFLFLGNKLQVVTFEPEPSAVVEVNGINCPEAVGPTKYKTLFVNRRPTTSSLLKPNRRIVDRYNWERNFPGQGNIFETVREIPIETTPMDDAIRKHGLPTPDFLKIDVQGLTYEVLEGAKRSLTEAVMGIQVEMEFSECYEGQKTFGAVHEMLNDAGFEVFGLSNINAWTYLTVNPVVNPRGQETFCDITYFRSIDCVGRDGVSTREELEKLVGLLLLFDFNDAAMAYLDRGVKCGLIELKHPAFRLATEWPGSIEFFYEPKKKKGVLRRILTMVLDLSPRKIIRFAKSLIL
jgi:FkbM family methyltransferase